MDSADPLPPRDSGGAGPIPARRAISRGRRRLFGLAIVAGLLAFQEIGFRAVFPFPEVYPFNRIHYAPLYHGPQGPEETRLTSGLSRVTLRVESQPDGFAFDHSLNLYGFRGRDFAIAPPGDRPRVVFVGDSFVEGLGAGDEDTIPARFARTLAKHRPVEAINLGIIGVNFPEYARLVRDSLALLRPDAIFLVVYANDLPAPPVPPEAKAPPPAFRPLDPLRPRGIQVVRRLRRGLNVPCAFHAGPLPLYRPVPSPCNLLTNFPPPENTDPQILEAMRQGRANPSLLRFPEAMDGMLRADFARGGGASEYLEPIAAACRRHQVELVVVYIPYLVTTNPAYRSAQDKLGGRGFAPGADPNDPSYRRQQDHLRAVTGALGIPLLDMTEELTRAEARRRMYWAFDTHCTPAGYRLIARACARYWSDGRRPDPSRDGPTVAIRR
jgi:lysophospholipase L1-like esterase